MIIINIRMEELYKTIYKKIIEPDIYDTYNDEDYFNAYKKLSDVENEISNILKNNLNNTEIFEMMEKLQMAINDIQDLYEYRDFKYYFSAGLAIGLIAKDSNDKERFENLAKEIRNSL